MQDALVAPSTCHTWWLSAPLWEVSCRLLTAIILLCLAQVQWPACQRTGSAGAWRLKPGASQQNSLVQCRAGLAIASVVLLWVAHYRILHIPCMF